MTAANFRSIERRRNKLDIFRLRKNTTMSNYDFQFEVLEMTLEIFSHSQIFKMRVEKSKPIEEKMK